MPLTEQALPAQNKGQTGLFTTGLALFSMFFGAGNLIFPLLIGKTAGSNIWYAIAGLGLTAVAVPFLGLAAMVLFQADTHKFFCRVGRIPGLGLLLLLQLILGPLGVIPRLVTLMQAISAPYLHDMGLPLFSILAAVVVFGCSFKREFIIRFLGAILTPILLLSIAALVFFGMIEGAMSPESLPPGESFMQGLLGGYNTMDLISAFLFATIVLPHFQKGVECEHPALRRSSLIRKMVFSSLIAAALLFFTYIGLCLISANHGWQLDPSLPSEQMLSSIAMKLLGPIGGCIAAVAVITACLTTAITLSTIFADYLRKDLCKNKISPIAALIVTLIMTTLIANLGFSGIAAFLGPILQVIYPGLIVLTVANLYSALKKRV